MANKITMYGVKVVWIAGLNLQRFWRLYSFFFSAFNDQFEKHQAPKKSVLSGIQTPRSGLKKNSAAPCFSTHFAVLGFPDETRFLVFDILHDAGG